MKGSGVKVQRLGGRQDTVIGRRPEMTGDLRVYQADESNNIETSNTKIREKEDTKNSPMILGLDGAWR
jgi:hypothetical protein